jgi:hypothetical protein
VGDLVEAVDIEVLEEDLLVVLGVNVSVQIVVIGWLIN